jgi:hypothetical protein
MKVLNINIFNIILSHTMNVLQNKVGGYLSELSRKGVDRLYDLFYTLGYEFQNEDLTFITSRWTENQKSLVDKITLLASHNGFSVFWVRMKDRELLRTPERTIINKLTSEFPYNMIVFSNADDRQWDFVNMKLVKEEESEENKNPRKRQILRRIRIETSERLRTAIERIAMLAVPEEGASSLELQKRHDEAFDVEAVSEAFFKHFQIVFSRLRDNLANQTGDKEWAHAFTLQFLNRLMFIYFIQKKRWLGGDPEFVRSYWEVYQTTVQLNDTFVNKWLGVLFFEAFNKRFSHPRWLPEEFRKILQMAPFLNGGLFKRNDLDTKHTVTITDSQFKDVFDFLQQYNFTITEESPIEREVAVDPEMIGKVYESLVNVSEEVDERGEAGIFYTPRTEITLMCRLALVDRFANEFSNEHRNLFYELLFALTEEDKQEADKRISEQNLWPEIGSFLDQITVLDPAVGSGSFLVGMLNILADLKMRANNQLGIQETIYRVKKNIVGRSLYGVDIMDWAVHVCELRLWLQLVVETDLKPEERTIEPLLPNLDLNIRTGDSLVQMVGEVNFSHLRLTKLPRAIRGKITTLKGEKRKYFYNDPSRKYKLREQVDQAELNIFREILDQQIQSRRERLKEIDRIIKGIDVEQEGLFGYEPKQKFIELKKVYIREQHQLQDELGQFQVARQALKDRKDIPFVWDISFAEIFGDDKRGFDIVIGNPPYVRQELIADPREDPENYGGDTSAEWKVAKKAYKEKLMLSVYAAYPDFFHFDIHSKTVKRKLDAKNDLYVYFYLRGLSLLNEKGSFCFVTSNSWLDVGYGKDLQEFLIKHVPVKKILDNQVRRTFKSADVNTIICLFGAPSTTHRSPATSHPSPVTSHHTAKFVMFYVPFDQVLDPIIFEEIEEATKRTKRPEYRVVPKSKEELFEGGLDKERAKAKRIDAYVGDKWGGKYLRAPDIYYTNPLCGLDECVFDMIQRSSHDELIHIL